MFNPWILLGVAVFYVASVGGAFFKGKSYQEAEDRAGYAMSLEAELLKANEVAETDKKAAIKVAARNAAAQARASAIRSQTSVVIREKPLPVVCDWDSSTFSLLSAAIQAANNTSQATADGLSSAVRAANGTGK